MASADLKRNSDLKRLLELYRSKVDHKPTAEARERAAQSLMDRALGPEWRGEAALAGLGDVDAKPKEAGDREQFYRRLEARLSDEGAPMAGEIPTGVKPAHDEVSDSRTMLILQILTGGHE